MKKILDNISELMIIGSINDDNDLGFLDEIMGIINGQIVYPKNKILQVILDPETMSRKVIINCLDIKFFDLRDSIMSTLKKKNISNDAMMQLQVFVNNLCDNEKELHLHDEHTIHDHGKVIHLYPVVQTLCDKLELLYKKAIELGIPRGYINLYPDTMLKKIAESSLLKIIYKNIKTSQELKDILRFLNENNEKIDKLSCIVTGLPINETLDLIYLINLPALVLDVAVKGINFHSKCCHTTLDKISRIEILYKKDNDVFQSISNNPSFSKFLFSNASENFINNFIKMIWHHEVKIKKTKQIIADLSMFLQTKSHEDENSKGATALMKLAYDDLDSCKRIITNHNAINILGIKLEDVCELALHNKKIFDMLFCHYNHTHNIITSICEDEKITINDLLKILIMGNISDNILKKIKHFDENMLELE